MIVASIICLVFFVAWFNFCCCDCELCDDVFDRANSSDIDTGSDCGWTEEAGAAEINNNHLRITASNTRIISDTTAPNAAVALNGTIHFLAHGDVFKVFFDYVDSTDHHYAQFELIDDTTVEMSLDGTDPVPIAIVDWVAIFFPFYICVSRETSRVVISFGNEGVGGDTIIKEIGLFDGGKFGPGSGSIGSYLEVGEFHAMRTDLPGCHCVVTCNVLYECPLELRVDLIDNGAIDPTECGGDCAIFDGASIYLPQTFSGWTSGCVPLVHSPTCAWSMFFDVSGCEFDPVFGTQPNPLSVEIAVTMVAEAPPIFETGEIYLHYLEFHADPLTGVPIWHAEWLAALLDNDPPFLIANCKTLQEFVVTNQECGNTELRCIPTPDTLEATITSVL